MPAANPLAATVVAAPSPFPPNPACYPRMPPCQLVYGSNGVVVVPPPPHMQPQMPMRGAVF